MSILDVLPDEIIAIIFSKVSYNDLLMIRTTNKEIKKIVDDNRLIENKYKKLDKFIDKIDLRGWKKVLKGKNNYFSILYKDNMIKIIEDNMIKIEINVNEFYIYSIKSMLAIIENKIIHLVFKSNYGKIEYYRYVIKDFYKYTIKDINKIILTDVKIYLILNDNRIMLESFNRCLYKIMYIDDKFILYKIDNKNVYRLVVYNEFGVFFILQSSYNKYNWELLDHYPQCIHPTLHKIFGDMKNYLNFDHFDKVNELVEVINENIRKWYNTTYLVD
jgi:hypothetical protein